MFVILELVEAGAGRGEEDNVAGDGGCGGALDGGFEVEPNSRLSCQLIMTPNLDGLKVTLTNDSSN